MITAVLFDLFETLITESQVGPARASSLAAVLGLDDGAYRREWRVRRPRIVVGELSFAGALTEISRTLAGRVDAKAIQRICQQRMREKASAYAHPDDRITSLITQLARRRMPLGVVSNAFSEDVRPWSGCSLASAFRCTAFSCDEGVAKPDAEIYRRAVDRLGVTPGATVYIGDGTADELAGAKRAGLRPYRATWFVRDAFQTVAWPELEDCRDVLALVDGQPS